MIPPSEWVKVHLDQMPCNGQILDLACGSGRHARLLAAAGYSVVAVDRDEQALSGLAGIAGIETRCLDLEGEEWPLAGEQFSRIVVTNYLWRPRLQDLASMLQPGGVLIYETFMVGNEAFGKPSNPDFLLRPGELRRFAEEQGWSILAFAEGEVSTPKPAVTQRICALKQR